jgi:hypothetical protein
MTINTLAFVSALAWVGLAVSAVLLGVSYYLLGLLGKEVFTRLRRVYHLSVVWYWLDRLEKLGTHKFMRPHPDPNVDPMVAPPPDEPA